MRYHKFLTFVLQRYDNWIRGLSENEIMKTVTTDFRWLWMTLVFSAATLVTFSGKVRAGVSNDLQQLVRSALAEDTATARRATTALREKGDAGLDALFSAYAADIEKALTSPAFTISKNSSWQRMSAALDAVSRQRDCFASRLYWQTDFEKAKAAARESGKPILSLRLLGNLDEEYSCANSRFFRTVLYANAEVSRRLREHFVLHWESVRPAPKISIDFGDGRKLERTITGNSIHYILDSEGRVVDALPGLYGPQAFLRMLVVAEDAALASEKQSPENREKFLQKYHQAHLAENLAQWNEDLVKSGAPVKSAVSLSPGRGAPAADLRAFSKSRVERPLVRAAVPTRETLARTTEDTTWASIAALHAADSSLDSGSLALIRIKNSANPSALEAGRLAVSKAVVETPMMRAVRGLERSLAEDTVRNEYLFHTTIHEWFTNGAAPSDLKALNEKVYAELFLTPSTDPWLGLNPKDTYSALDNNGVAITAPVEVGK